ncbi:hypothetical protein [Haloplanus sp. C73]|uniref:hypothetical protein n=1 Tax=Haloplanus sp. C73 TaxID=3421641 RepID=UPI003EB9DEF5
MLSEYIPELYPVGRGDRYKLKGILRTKAATRSPQQTPYSFYVPQSTVYPVAVSSREIAKVIDYSVLPDDHPLSKRSRDDPVDEPELLGEYTRIKGTVTHTLAAESYDDAQAVLDEELAKLDNPREVQRAAAGEPDAPRLRELADPLSTEPRNDLREAIMDEAYGCTTNVQMVERGLNLRNLMTETLLVDTVDCVPLAVKPDAIKYAEELFVTEIKATHILKPEHIVQTEVYRRAVEERLAKPPHALILRVDVDNCEVVHLAPDSQLCSTAWELFRQRAGTPGGDEGVYNQDLLRIIRDKLDRERR